MTLREFLTDTSGSFIIESYQRPYIWGRPHHDRPDSATMLLDALQASHVDRTDYMLHSITLSKREDGYEVVDGQQRIVFLFLLLRALDCEMKIDIKMPYRKASEKYLKELTDIGVRNIICHEPDPSEGIDIYHFCLSLLIIDKKLKSYGLGGKDFTEFILDRVHLTPIVLPDGEGTATVFKMITGAKSQIDFSDAIKAALLRGSDTATPDSTPLKPDADEWDSMVNWWTRPDVREYFMLTDCEPLKLPIQLAMGVSDDDASYPPLSYYEFQKRNPNRKSRIALYRRIRTIHRRMVDAYTDAETYNRIRAILLLQEPADRDLFLRLYFRDSALDPDALTRYYKLSFLGMGVEKIRRGDSPSQAFDELLAVLSTADVYHSEARRDAYNLLLRLNIDEDIKLGRKFDFSIWDNRSLEHIYSKSKVWHIDSDGMPRDGNESPIHTSIASLHCDRSFLHREKIANADGAVLSEHCIGNLVLLYGQNNASFGNASFDTKKQMFLAPGDQTVFRSRNLLHSVCVFSGSEWGAREIVENYNRTLKNLKLYYGYK